MGSGDKPLSNWIAKASLADLESKNPWISNWKRRAQHTLPLESTIGDFVVGPNHSSSRPLG